MTYSHKSSNLGWHGSLDLVYTYQNNTTKLTHSLAKAPLKIQKPFYPEGKQTCHTIVLQTSGGVVGGDNLNQNIYLQPQSQVLITTAAAGKVYRSNGLQAKQTININIESGACLEWLPQENIIFNGAIYRQDLRVELAPNSMFVGQEITRLGRTARGEKYYQGEWRSHIEIWQEQKPLLIDRQWLRGGQDIIDSPNGLAGKPIVATLICMGKPISKQILQQLIALKPLEGETGFTTTQGQGLLCRYRGSSSSEVKNWFMEIWGLLRLHQLQRHIIKPRVWQL